jgi:hypothetical protein
MPLAAVRTPDIALLISVSGAGVVPADTTLDQARNEMTFARMRPEVIEQILNLMRLEYRFAQTGEGWDDYIAARQQLATRLGAPPPNFPGTQDDPLWRTPDLAAPADADARHVRRAGQQHPRGKEQGGMGVNRFVPEYFTTVREWLGKRLPGFDQSR